MLVPSSVAVGDSTSGQVVGGKLDLHPIARQDANVVLAHLSGDRGEDIVAALLELNAEHGARQRLDDLSLDLDLVLFGYLPASFTFRETALRERGRMTEAKQHRTQHSTARAARNSW
jgi:hypothetical protein